jgi:uncharacterized protein YmfQ (DUF2313 family)
MARSPQLVLTTTLAIAPGGWALPADPASTWGKFLLPMATIWSGVEASQESLVQQVDPRSATSLLPAWVAFFSPDPCGLNVAALPPSQQQQYCYQRLTARGGASIGYFLSIAAAFGITATIREGAWSRAGGLRAGQRVCAPGNQFNWQVALPQTQVTKFRAGASSAGDRLGTFTPSLATCPIEHAAPAHTNVTFSYSGS